MLLVSDGLFLIKFNNTSVLPDPEPSIIKILYGWSEILGQFALWFISTDR